MSSIGPPEQDLGCFIQLITNQSGPAFALIILPQALLGQGVGFWLTTRATPVRRLAEHAGRRSSWIQLSTLPHALLGQGVGFRPTVLAASVGRLVEHAGQRSPWIQPSAHTRSRIRHPSSNHPLFTQAC